MAETPAAKSKDAKDAKAPGGNMMVFAVVFAVLGAGLGWAYGGLADALHRNHITNLSMGPIPGWVVGAVFGAAFGFILGAFVGAAGNRMLTARAGAGFLIGAGIFILGRFSDDTGEVIDKVMDMVVAGFFWGVIGSLVGAVLFDPEAEPLASEPEAGPARVKGKGREKSKEKEPGRAGSS